jgi:hypothetical protein
VINKNTYSKYNTKLLEIVYKSLKRFLETHPRSYEKLKPLHGGIKEDLLNIINSLGIKDINLISLDNNNTSEDVIEGRYYNKAVDISIRKNQIPIGAIAVKFVMNNYKQNANNYFENMLGETANIRTANIPYFQVLILFEKMPYFKNGGKLAHWEEISKDTHLKKYIKLSKDNVNEYYHTPILTLFTILSLPKEITEDETILNKNDFNNKLLNLINNNKLQLDFSSKFSPNIFKDNIILNNYKEFLDRVIHYFAYKGEFNS